MKWKEIFIAGCKKMGFNETEINAGLADLEGDVADDVATAKLKAIFTADEAKGNDSIFKEVKDKTKAEALNAIDDEFKKVEDALTADQKKAYTALGANTYEKNKYLMGVLKEKLTEKTPTGDVNFDTLKASYDELKGSLDTNYVKKEEHDALSSRYNDSRKELVHSKVLNTAMQVVKSEDKKKDRHFSRNFLTDMDEFLKSGIGKDKKKAFINYETGQVMREDSPEQPMMIGSDVLTLDKLVPLVAEFGEYNKGFTPPPTDPIRTRGAGGNNEPGDKPVPEAVRRMAERLEEQGKTEA